MLETVCCCHATVSRKRLRGVQTLKKSSYLTLLCGWMMSVGASSTNSSILSSQTAVSVVIKGSEPALEHDCAAQSRSVEQPALFLHLQTVDYTSFYV